MKNIIFIFALTIFAHLVYSQSSNIRKAERALENSELSLAQNLINEASKHEKTMNEGETWFLRGAIYQASLEKDQLEEHLMATIESYNKVFELENENDKYFKLANKKKQELEEKFINTGVEAYNRSDFDAAIDAFENALVANPSNTDAILYTGIAYQQNGEIQNSLKYYYRLIDVDYHREDIYNSIISIERNEKNFEKALEIAKQGQNQFPENDSFAKQENEILQFFEANKLLPKMKSKYFSEDKVNAFGIVTNYPNPSSSRNLGKHIPDSILTFKTFDIVLSNLIDKNEVKKKIPYEVDSIWFLKEVPIVEDEYNHLVSTKDYDGSYPAYWNTTEFSDAVDEIIAGKLSAEYGEINFWKQLNEHDLNLSSIDISLKLKVKKGIEEKGPNGESREADENSFVIFVVAENEVHDYVTQITRSNTFVEKDGEKTYENSYPVFKYSYGKEETISYDSMFLYELGEKRLVYDFKEKTDDFVLLLDYAEQLKNYYILKYDNYFTRSENQRSITRLSSFGFAIPGTDGELVKENMADFTVSTLIYQNELKEKQRLEKAKKERELKPLYEKYGKKYVDAAYNGEIITGMHIDLVEDLLATWRVYDINETESTRIYRLKNIISSDKKLRLNVRKKENTISYINFYTSKYD